MVEGSGSERALLFLDERMGMELGRQPFNRWSDCSTADPGCTAVYGVMYIGYMAMHLLYTAVHCALPYTANNCCSTLLYTALVH